MTPARPGAKCARPKCPFVVMNRGLCKKHYPIVYPPHLRGDVDATRAREHIAALRARGVTVRMLFEEYGIYDSVVYRIESVPSRIRRMTEAQVLAIPLPSLWVPSLADVDATGTRRRLQALGAIGYTQEDIGTRIGTIQRHIANLMGREKVSGVTAFKVAQVFNELQLTTGPSAIARRRAYLKGWPPPLAWDEDTIDDQAAQPFRERSYVPGFVERYTELVELGVPARDIPARMGITADGVAQSLDRHEMPIPPVIWVLIHAEKEARRVTSLAERAAS